MSHTSRRKARASTSVDPHANHPNCSPATVENSSNNKGGKSSGGASSAEQPKTRTTDEVADLPPTPQCVIDQWHDVQPEEKVGYKRPPVKNRFVKGKSGNPSGKRKGSAAPPGNVLENLGLETIEQVLEILLGRVTDLQVKPDDLVTTAVAKMAISEGLKKDGTFRKFLLTQLFEKPLQSQRLAPVDKGEQEAQILQKMISAIVDPAVKDEDFSAILDQAADHYETYGEFGARRRMQRKQRRSTRHRA